MKRFLLLLLSAHLLSIVTYSQTPTPTPVPAATGTATAAATGTQRNASPSPTPNESGRGLPNLPTMVEIFASAVMFASVIGALWSLRGGRRVIEGPDGPQVTYDQKGAINPRHIQFISVGLIVPTILILGLEKVLTSETSATLIGGLAGYLLSGIGKYEPRPKGPNHDNDKTKKSGNDKEPNQNKNPEIVQKAERYEGPVTKAAAED